jgi:hypothetical protein
MLIHTLHGMPMPHCAVDLRSRFQNEMVEAWHGRGMSCVNQTRPQCVDQMGKTQSTPFWHGMAGKGMGATWYMCQPFMFSLVRDVVTAAVIGTVVNCSVAKKACFHRNVHINR